MPITISPQLSGQILGIIAQAEDKNRLLEVNSNGYVQEASKFKHFVVAVKSLFTGVDYKTQSYDSAKSAFISRLKSDVLSTEQNGAALWTQLQDRVTALYWSPGQLGVEFNANQVLTDLEKAFGEINVKNYEFTRSAGITLQTFQNEVVSRSGTKYQQGMHVGTDPKTMDKKELPDIRKVPGLYGNDSSFGFQTEKSQRIFLEKYSAAEQSGLPKLLANNIDHVGPKSELALLAIYSHDYLLESALKYVETDHSGDPLNDDDFELGTNNYLKILYNIDQALKCESPIDEIHDLLLQDFDDLNEPTPEFLSLYEPLTAETGSYVVIDESETKDANSSAVIPENKVETTGAHNIISENVAKEAPAIQPNPAVVKSQDNDTRSLGADSFDAVSVTSAEDAAIIAANLAALPSDGHARGADALEQTLTFREIPSFTESVGQGEDVKKNKPELLWDKVKQSIFNGDLKRAALASTSTSASATEDFAVKVNLSDAGLNAQRDLNEQATLNKQVTENNPTDAQNAKLEEAKVWKALVADASDALLPEALKLK